MTTETAHASYLAPIVRDGIRFIVLGLVSWAAFTLNTLENGMAVNSTRMVQVERRLDRLEDAVLAVKKNTNETR